MTDPTSVQIQIFSDVICPWCFIGTRRLVQALAAMPKVKAVIRIHPYFIDPRTPPEGTDLRETLKKAFGGDPDLLFVRVEKAARSSGIPLDFSKVRRTVPTVKAHTLLRYAWRRNTQVALSIALFEAYFLEGKDISNDDVLSDLGQRYGTFTDRDARTLISSQQARIQTRLEAKVSAESGMQGLPFFTFNQRVSIPGAATVERFQAAIQATCAT